jgi:hypothetical protein
MGFYNVHEGDAPYLKFLADTYTMSDNYHQPMMGGTGANHIMMGMGAPIWFSDGKGNPAPPPNYGVNPDKPTVAAPGNPNSVSEIENPIRSRGRTTIISRMAMAPAQAIRRLPGSRAIRGVQRIMAAVHT